MDGIVVTKWAQFRYIIEDRLAGRLASCPVIANPDLSGCGNLGGLAEW
ncbi:MAG: hypothetical protein R6V59_01980 [Dehalococcoidia bacterium]